MGSYTYKYEERFQYLTNICLNVTDACNLKCRYCFVAQNPHFMDLQTAKDAMDWLHKNLEIKKEKKFTNEKDKCSVNFFGGEPMLLYDKIIVPTVEYCEKKYPGEFHFGMTTNGTLLNEEKIKWLYNHKFSLLLSIDGAKITQDFNRPCQDESLSSFDLVSKNIPYILKYFPNTTFRSTIYQYTVGHLLENYKFAEKMGFKNIFMIPNGREKWSQENIGKLTSEVEKLFLYMQNKYMRNEKPIECSIIGEVYKEVIKEAKILLKQEKLPDLDEIKNVNRCGLGTTSGSIAYNGDIYACQEQDSKSHDSMFYIGNIYENGIDRAKHECVLKEYAYSGRSKSENKELCYKCLLRNICQRYACPSTSYDCFDDMSKVCEIHCIWRNLLYYNAQKMIYFLIGQNNQLFINTVLTPLLNVENKNNNNNNKR